MVESPVSVEASVLTEEGPSCHDGLKKIHLRRHAVLLRLLIVCRHLQVQQSICQIYAHFVVLVSVFLCVSGFLTYSCLVLFVFFVSCVSAKQLIRSQVFCFCHRFFVSKTTNAKKEKKKKKKNLGEKKSAHTKKKEHLNAHQRTNGRQ